MSRKQFTNVTSNTLMDSLFQAFIQRYNQFRQSLNDSERLPQKYNALLQLLQQTIVHMAKNPILFNQTVAIESKINRTYTDTMTKFKSNRGNPVVGIPYLPLYIYIIIITIFAVIALIAVMGNALVGVILIRNRSKKVYEIFCISLALTDLMFAMIAIPMTMLHYITLEWQQWLCRLANYSVYVCLQSSSLVLVGLTYSRFLAVVHPWRDRRVTLTEAKLACVFAWMAGLLFAIPVALYYTVKPRNKLVKVCEDDFPSISIRTAYIVCNFVIAYVIPFVSIIVMNSMIVSKLRQENLQRGIGPRELRQRKRMRRVTMLVLLITSLYCLCWLPTHIINIWHMVARETMPRNHIALFVKVISQALSFASTCINPIVYSIMSGSFKSAIFRQCPSLARHLFSSPQRDDRPPDEMQRCVLTTANGTTVCASVCATTTREVSFSVSSPPPPPSSHQSDSAMRRSRRLFGRIRRKTGLKNGVEGAMANCPSVGGAGDGGCGAGGHGMEMISLLENKNPELAMHGGVYLGPQSAVTCSQP